MFNLTTLRDSFHELHAKISEMYNGRVGTEPLKHGQLDAPLDTLHSQLTFAHAEKALEAGLHEHLEHIIAYVRTSENVGWVTWNDKLSREVGYQSLLTPEQQAEFKAHDTFLERVAFVKDHL